MTSDYFTLMSVNRRGESLIILMKWNIILELQSGNVYTVKINKK